MAKEDYYRQLAYDYMGQARLLRCRASVHLEYDVDEWFWDMILQRHYPAKYNYIYYSRNKEGNVTAGCTQCLQFKNYLSRQFFICIDSDFRYLQREAGINANSFICQTYTYSWENHYCFAKGLQRRLGCWEKGKSCLFSFEVFLQSYSEAVYEPLLLFLYMNKHGLAGFSNKRLSMALSLQYKNGDLYDNGRTIVERLEQAFNAFIPDLKARYRIDMEQVKTIGVSLGVTKANAYLHVRGHNLYNLVKSIGRHLARDFEYEVLLKELPESNQYWEIEKIADDLNVILA